MLLLCCQLMVNLFGSYLIVARKHWKVKRKSCIGTRLIIHTCQMNRLMMMLKHHFIESINHNGGLKVDYNHLLLWLTRYSYSTALNSLIKKVDDRMKKNEVQGAKRGGFLRYERQLSTPLLNGPPENGPSWAIQVTSRKY